MLVDREVSPQLGLLKSTLLQLDSTFSERDYGASTFRDFIEKVAQTGMVSLRHSGRSLLVELPETNGGGGSGNATGSANGSGASSAPAGGGDGAASAAPQSAAGETAGDAQTDAPAQEGAVEAAEAVDATPPTDAREGAAPVPPVDSAQARQAIQRAQDTFGRATQPPRWPMYVRQVKQYLRAADEGFDERKSGFATIVEFLRACQREGVFRLERDRQGVLRVFPGANLQRPISQIGTVAEPAEAAEPSELPLGDPAEAPEEQAQASLQPEAHTDDTGTAPDVRDGVTVEGEQEAAAEPESPAPEGPEPARTIRPRRSVKKTTAGRPAARKSTGAKTAAARAPRARRKTGHE